VIPQKAAFERTVKPSRRDGGDSAVAVVASKAARRASSQLQRQPSLFRGGSMFQAAFGANVASGAARYGFICCCCL